MTISAKGVWGVSLAILLFSSLLLPQAQAATKFVANNGIDSSVCGISAATACRSISQAIANAADGDVIIVGPAATVISTTTAHSPIQVMSFSPVPAAV